ncbi:MULTISPECIES: type VII secretion protein EccB [Nocardia]|uniref:type VII secretion protein EccB n=1 Tax=Nocardia TaxID=1817 RepID=UPI0018937F15|nr:MULTISPECIES: type VII secretion protein EccB [Nocardia]MBF6351422.1 type VII secretion protein EccB [Nocardia flavorosea]
MPAQLTTRAQVNGYRFLLKRIQHALVRRDVRMLHDPMRAQIRSMVVGLVFAVLIVAGCAILGLIRPQGQVGNAKIVTGKDTGALFVMVDGTLHPVLNAASARLITGSTEKPASVKESKLAEFPRGPLLGIPGAPVALLGSASDSRNSQWSLCESTTPVGGLSRIVVAGAPRLDETIRPLSGDEAVLVSAAGKNYLLWDGRSAEFDPGNDAVTRALGLRSGTRFREAGVGLLNATAPVPPLTPPVIERAGQPGPVPGTTIGSVIKVAGPDSAELYVVVAGGVQRITPFTAEVIRYADSQGLSEVPAVPPDALRGVAVVEELPVGLFPATRPRIVSPDVPVVCVAWSRADTAQTATLRLLTGQIWPLPDTAVPAVAASAGSDTDRIDAAYIRPSSGEFVQVTGNLPDSARRGALYYIADTGIRYGIPDLATAEILGLGREPAPAPWQIVGQLVPGPSLSRAAALVAYDSLAQE